MTARPSRFGTIIWGDEASFGEASPTIDVRQEFLGELDVSGLKRESIEADFTGQYGTEGFRRVAGPKEGSFSMTLALTGHGTDPGAGALTPTDLSILLGYIIGGRYSANVGTTADGAGTALAFDVNGGTIGNSSGILVGTKGDGRGNGQAYLVNGESGGTVTLYNAMQAAPSAADAVRPMISVYPRELPASFDDITSLAFRLQTANEQYDCHGCWCESWSLAGFNHRERPSITLNMRAARWEQASATFPSTIASNAKEPTVVMGGSLWLSTSTSYQVLECRSFSASFAHQVFVEESTCVNGLDQVVAGVKYGPCRMSVQTTVEAETVGTETWKDLFDAQTGLSMMYTANGVPGKALALWARRLKWNSQPVQVSTAGLNTVSLDLVAEVTPTTTNDQTLANFQLLMG